jgi:hypothetical protein
VRRWNEPCGGSCSSGDPPSASATFEQSASVSAGTESMAVEAVSAVLVTISDDEEEDDNGDLPSDE